MEVTPIYAGFLGLLLAILSARVIGARRAFEVSLGDGKNATLERRIRAQGNLAEYGPIAIILIGILEISGYPAPVLHVIGLLLLAGRFLHGWALSFTQGSAVGRVGGMILTLSEISIASLLNIYLAANALIGD